MENHKHNAVNNKIEYIKFFLIIIAILFCASFIVYPNSLLSIAYMMAVMGLFFIVFGIFQLFGYKSFVEMFSEYDPIAKRISVYSYLFPFIGIALGILYLIDIGGIWRDGITAFIMLTGAWGVYRTIQKDKVRPHCACLGNIIKLPLSWITLAEDLIMGIMALLMLINALL